MSRIAIPSLDNSPAESRPVLDAVNQQLGSVPNLFRLLGNSPAALEDFGRAHGKDRVGPELGGNPRR